MRAPTPRQLDTLRALEGFALGSPLPPTLDDLRVQLGLRSKTAVKLHIDQLVEQGLVGREPMKARAVWLTPAGRERLAVLATLAGAP